MTSDEAWESRKMSQKPIALSTDLLVELGYGSLTIAQANTLLREFYNTLKEVVGATLAQRMNDKQLDAFETFYEAGDDAGALAWLERNIPDYRAVVERLFEELATELRNVAHPSGEYQELTSEKSTEREGA
jgi:hypothetical protein